MTLFSDFEWNGDLRRNATSRASLPETVQLAPENGWLEDFLLSWVSTYFLGGELLVLGKGIRFSSFSDQPFDSEQKKHPNQRYTNSVNWVFRFSPLFQTIKSQGTFGTPKIKKKTRNSPSPKSAMAHAKRLIFGDVVPFPKRNPFPMFPL